MPLDSSPSVININGKRRNGVMPNQGNHPNFLNLLKKANNMISYEDKVCFVIIRLLLKPSLLEVW